jgi:hypothetical protein
MPARRSIVVALIAAALLLPASAYGAFQYPEAPPTQAPGVVSQPATVAPPTTPPPPADQFGLVAPTYVPPGVNNQGVYVTPLPPGAKVSTATYSLDWTIGVAGKSGCLVCHADKNLVRIINGKAVSLWVDTLVLDESAHAALLCTDCHVDFAYKTPHPNANDDTTWRALAKSSCKNCHRPEFLDWAKSSHSIAGTPGSTSTVGAANSSAPGKPRPLCGDCHGGHAIPSKTDTAAVEAVRASALTMCGNCHVLAASSYQDYYHGAAYRRGAPDAPACWQCHNTHLVLPSRDLNSWTNAQNLDTTCGQCHKAVGTPLGPGYTQYATLIHRRESTLQSNPVYAAVATATSTIQNVFNKVISTFRRNGS